MKNESNVQTLEDQHELFLKHCMELERNPKINGKTLSQRKKQAEQIYGVKN